MVLECKIFLSRFCTGGMFVVVMIFKQGSVQRDQ